MTVWGLTRFAMLRSRAGIMSFVGALAFFNVAPAAGAEKPLYQFAPAPRWVTRVTAEYDAPLPSGGVSDGTWDLLLDRQVNVTADGDEYYQRSAVKVTNTSGVDERSQIDIIVDPTYQTLSLHSILVVRAGRVVDQRPLARITALPQETELRVRVYDGSYKINILLSDVRVDDVVEYDYTIRSRERVFPGVFSDRMSIGWSVPMRRARLRILAPAGLELSYRVGDPSVPTTSLHGGIRELDWDWHDLAAIPGDDNRPKWYSTWPHIEVTSTKDWSEVAQRIAPLYEVSNPRTPELSAVVNEIRAAGGTPAEQALRALQFVQEQIRYVSISIGAGAFRPTNPEQVLQRRFGDCKDKSLLLVTILRQLGIEAQPALVNTRRGHVLDSTLPTPYAFDHVIVRMRLDNDTYWLDGTLGKQFSPLSTHFAEEFERALVIDRSTTGLTTLPPLGPDAHSKRSEVLVDLRAGLDKPAKLQISTFYEGRLADSQRQDLADESTAERQSSYLKYILEYYPRAKVAAPITVHDDRSKDVIEVREYYNIEHPFKENERGRLELFLQADELYRYVEPLKPGARKAPLAIGRPVRVQQIVRALLPQELKIQNETVRVDNPAFRYQSTVSYAKQAGVPQITLDYRYESFTDFVDVAALPKYQDDRNRVYDDLGYSVRPPVITETFVKQARLGPLASVPKWVAWLSLFFASWLASRFLYRWDPPAAKSEADGPVGIRGWLLIPAVVVILAPLGWFGRMYREGHFLEVDRWSHLHDKVPEPWKAWAAAILLVLTVCGVCLLVASAFLAYLFFTMRSSTPYVFIAIQWFGAAYSAALLLFPIAAHLTAPLEDGRLANQLAVSVVVAGLYTAYFLLSERVKATFVARLAEPRLFRYLRDQHSA